ncbi:type II toxin-antitoxin system antitoxin, RelB/DinJ family, partial [Acinetobacter oleivorans]|nr:type II toxin-antitoxin system antitoxin, RelB/DinJ family [Acinetobacter oleivorans]
INMEQLLKLRKAKASSLNQNLSTLAEDDDHEDLFEELNALLGESDKT